MRDVILLITCSLDGLIAAEDGNVDWLLHEDEYDFDGFLDGVDTLLMGYNTYNQVLSFGKWPYEGKECFVFTKEHLFCEDDTVTFSEDLVGTVQELVLGTGRSIWVVGGASIVSQLLNKGLIGELKITIQPVILGKGIPLFRNMINSVGLELTGTHEYSSGIVELAYRIRQNKA